MRSSGLRGHSIVFPDMLSGRSRLTRRWVSVRSALCQVGSWDQRLQGSACTQSSLNSGANASWRSIQPSVRACLRLDPRLAGHTPASGKVLAAAPQWHSHHHSFPGALRRATLDASVQSPLRRCAGNLEVSGTHRHPTMRSSGPRGQDMVFPDVASARGRLTRR
jgi:hypothetical protein